MCNRMGWGAVHTHCLYGVRVIKIEPSVIKMEPSVIKIEPTPSSAEGSGYGVEADMEERNRDR